MSSDIILNLQKAQNVKIFLPCFQLKTKQASVFKKCYMKTPIR